MEDKKPAIFARNATGLVREISPIGMFFFVIAVLGIFFDTYYADSLAPLLGGNIGGAFLLCLVSIGAFSVVYYSFNVAMPRSGGDYVYVSRVLHPSLGFVGNILIGFFLIVYVSVNAVEFNTTGLGALFSYLGVTQNSSFWTNVGSFASSQTGTIILGIIFIGLASTVAISSLRLYLKIQRISLYIILFTVALFLASLAFTSHANFVSSFNSFTSKYTGSQADYYSNVTATATDQGWAAPGGSLFATLSLFTLISSFAIVQTNGAQLLGETRNVKRAALWANVGAAVFFVIVIFLSIILSSNVFGSNFYGGINYLLYTAPSRVPLPFLPYTDSLIAVAVNPVIAVIIFAVSAYSLFFFTPAAYMYFSRGLFAYSFDRIFPKWFSDLSPRTNSPLKATVVASIISLILFFAIELPFTTAYIYLFTSIITLVWDMVPYLMMGIAAIVVLKRRAIYQLLPIKGAELVIAGVVAIALDLTAIYFYLTNSAFGANTRAGLIIAASSIIACFVIYAISRLIRGPSLSLSFKEIPPE